MDGGVGALGGLLVAEGLAQHRHHRLHAGDGGRGDHGVGEIDVQGGGLGDQEAAEPVGGFDDPGSPVGGAGSGFPGSHQQPVDDLVEQVVLVAYMVVKGHRGYAQVGGQAADGHLLIAPGTNGALGGVDDLLTFDRPPRALFRPLGAPRGVFCVVAIGPWYAGFAVRVRDCDRFLHVRD